MCKKWDWIFFNYRNSIELFFHALQLLIKTYSRNLKSTEITSYQCAEGNNHQGSTYWNWHHDPYKADYCHPPSKFMKYALRFTHFAKFEISGDIWWQQNHSSQNSRLNWWWDSCYIIAIAYLKPTHTRDKKTRKCTASKVKSSCNKTWKSIW